MLPSFPAHGHIWTPYRQWHALSLQWLQSVPSTVRDSVVKLRSWPDQPGFTFCQRRSKFMYIVLWYPLMYMPVSTAYNVIFDSPRSAYLINVRVSSMLPQRYFRVKSKLLWWGKINQRQDSTSSQLQPTFPIVSSSDYCYWSVFLLSTLIHQWWFDALGWIGSHRIISILRGP